MSEYLEIGEIIEVAAKPVKVIGKTPSIEPTTSLSSTLSKSKGSN